MDRFAMEFSDFYLEFPIEISKYKPGIFKAKRAVIPDFYLNFLIINCFKIISSKFL